MFDPCPRRAAEGSMDRPTHDVPHRITVCTSCRHAGEACRPGHELIARLRAAIAAVGDAVTEAFEVSGVACMAGCERPCAVAYQASGKATYLFGDIDPADDVGDLIAFARQYAGLADGWCSSTTRPGRLRHATLARVPAGPDPVGGLARVTAAMVATEAGAPR
jgi:predicted metal-binding protein